MTAMGTGTTFPPITDWCYSYEAQKQTGIGDAEAGVGT